MRSASARGHVSIASLSSGVPTTVLNNALHHGYDVTDLCWNEDGSKLYAADSRGLVSCSKVSVGESIFPAYGNVAQGQDVDFESIDKATGSNLTWALFPLCATLGNLWYSLVLPC